MRYTFMHKETAVAEIELDNTTGLIQKILAVYAPEHLPVGVFMRNGAADRSALNEWWMDRAIPFSRSGIRKVLKVLNISSPTTLLLSCYGLSLSDQYWIRPEHSDLEWEQINFFKNGFSGDVGDILFGADKENANLCSPDCTTDGNLKKRWKIIDGKRCLLKGGSAPFFQQPFNEVIATEIMARLSIPHIPYTLMWLDNEPYSVCEDFITEDIDLIPAWRIMQTQKKSNSTSVYQHFVNCCAALGIEGVIPFLDRMIVIDYMIANEDRHLNNFGLLRNAETLEWCGFAPMYDSGTSLGYDKLAGQIRSGKKVVCKPFKMRHEKQLELVSDFSWIDFKKLTDVKDMATKMLSADNAAEYIGRGRSAVIAESVWNRIQTLTRLSSVRSPVQTGSTENDVKENIAKKYT